MRFTPSTMTRLLSVKTSMILPSTPLSLPAMTRTWSPFLILSAISEHLRCERNNAHELLVAKFTADGAEDTGTARVTVGLQKHGCVLVETDVGTVRTTALLHRAYDDSLDDFTLLDVAARDSVLHGSDDRVADTRVASTRTAEHTDAKDFLCTGVVGDFESRLLLDHRISPTWPSRGLPRRANAWWPTADESP